MAKIKVLICPYCGETQPAGERCRVCAGLFEPLSRQATHNAMGPWFVRDGTRPFQPGCSYETLARMVEAGRITKYSIIRGPTTKQFWTIAKHVAGVSHLLGYCHHCDANVDPNALGCPQCGAPFGAYLDRNHLGLPDVRPLPWEAEIDSTDAAETTMQSMFDVRHAPPSRGISSFATDEELRGNGGRFAASRASVGSSSATASGDSGPGVAPAERAMLGAAPDDDDSLVEPAGAFFESQPDYAAEAARRSLQRKLSHERRLVRILGVLLVASVALSAIIVFRANSILKGTRATEPADSTAAALTERADDDAATTGDGGTGAGEAPRVVDLPDPVTPPIGDATVDATDVTRGGPDSAAESPTPDPYRAEVARADELIAQSRDAERELTDRIRDLEEAIGVLRNILEHAPPASRPEGLADRVKLLETDLERLRLEEFFRDG